MTSNLGSRGFTRSSVVFGLAALPFAQARGEDHVDYRYEDYAEEGGRIHIRTHGVLFEKSLKSWLSLKGNFVYDGISGATPSGTPPVPGDAKGYQVTIEDIRRAGYLEPTFQLENHSFSPQISYSKEQDYESLGVSLSHSIELNEKNTTITWGVSHSFDRVLPNPGVATPEGSLDKALNKDTTDFLIGVSQLLGPRTVLGVNFTIGYSDGYLSDPYKRVLFDDFPYNPGQIYTGFPENRPGHKLREVVYLSLQQALPSVQAAVVGSYRFHHDDWGTIAHTLGLEWRQKITRWVTLTPLFRYHTQTRADFYATHFPGDPTDPTFEPGIPAHYSADYRLSDLDSFTYGAMLSARVHDRVSIELGYKRYVMHGTDHTTDADQYPKANIVTAGVSLWF